MFLETFRADLDRYVYMTGRSALSCLVNTQGLWALAEYRFSHWVWKSVRVPVVRQVLRLVGMVWHKAVEITTGIDVNICATVGPGLYIGHFGGIFISGAAVIGENCNISQGVTVGLAGRGDQRGAPVIGNRVYIAPGAKIFGPIRIGDDVAVGANAVVTKDLPPGATAAGVPARVINMNGSVDFVEFRARGRKS
jgi:serine O-acetyltransferase